MASDRVALRGLIPVAFQTITLSNSTAVGLNSTIRNGPTHYFVFSIETNDVRMRADGTDPTLTTGVLYQSDNVYDFPGFNGTAALKFQRTTGTAKVSVMAFKHESKIS